MRTNLEHSNLFSPRVQGLRLNQVTLTLTTSFNIPTDGPTVWFFNGGAADRMVRLPQLSFEKQIVIANMGLTNSLNIADSVGLGLVTLAPGTVGIFYSGALSWTWLTGSMASTSVTITNLTGSASIAATDVIVNVNSAGAAVLTLPLSSAWLVSGGLRGLPLSIYDISGNASTNNITINTSGGQTISGQASLSITTDYGGYNLYPKTAGGWIFR